ncbi:MAG: hypothetical protein LAO51_16365 [Acidobacteriia bacterium]|nr:hypothetical protein [Terriglobia bacterium]
MKSRTIPGTSFDRTKPFYPLVTTYLIQLFGFREMAVRGLIGGPAYRAAIEPALTPVAEMNADVGQAERDRKKIENLLGVLTLRCEFDHTMISIDPDFIAEEVAARTRLYGRFMRESAATLLVLAYETCKDEAYQDRGPLWEFLRHSRNGIAHGGCFHFKRGEPVRSAQWGRFEIAADLHQTPVFKRSDGSGMLSIGDPIRLLWDIEQAYPAMRRSPSG